MSDNSTIAKNAQVQLYRWVKASERMPEKEGRTVVKRLGDPLIAEARLTRSQLMVFVTPNNMVWKGYKDFEWLEPIPSLNAGSLETDEEKTKALMGLVRYGWTCAAEQILDYCNETKVSPQFMDKIMELLDENNKQKFVFEIFQKHIPESSRPSLDIVDELRKANPYSISDGVHIKNLFDTWDDCCDKLRNLLNKNT